MLVTWRGKAGVGNVVAGDLQRRLLGGECGFADV